MGRFMLEKVVLKVSHSIPTYKSFKSKNGLGSTLEVKEVEIICINIYGYSIAMNELLYFVLIPLCENITEVTVTLG